MKGDTGRAVVCPVCGQLIREQKGYTVKVRGMARNAGTRTLVRRAVSNHFYSRHPALSSRERSLLLDRICIELGL
jgi:hypothetical protein